MTIADLAAALRGIPRDAYLLIDTADGPRPLAMVQIVRVSELVQHAAYERSGIILKTTR